MSAARRWVIGHGLFGRAVARSGAQEAHRVAVPWGDPEAAVATLMGALADFVSTDGALQIVWCAGKAVTSADEATVATEVGVFRSFLAAVQGSSADDRARLTVALASSVGGVYAGSAEPPFTEATPVAPLSPYGFGKLAMEDALRDAAADGRFRAFIGRLSNLYGPGQDLTKLQGLISVLTKAHLTDEPAALYVPLDTLRDYVYEDDAARIFSAATDRAGRTEPGSTTVKIVGNGSAVSIGALVSELQRLHRERGPILLGGGDARGQSLDLRVRSRVWTDLDALARTSLPEGLYRVRAAQELGLIAHGRPPKR